MNNEFDQTLPYDKRTEIYLLKYTIVTEDGLVFNKEKAFGKWENANNFQLNYNEWAQRQTYKRELVHYEIVVLELDVYLDLPEQNI